MAMQLTALKQRPDYTFKFNTTSGRHGWLRLTPAYSLKIVEELLAQSSSARFVLDPFCGTGTTPLAATLRGKHATSFDINPFLVWLAQVKCSLYSEAEIDSTERLGQEIITNIKEGTIAPAPPPPIHNIERWWDPEELLFLRLLKAGITSEARANTAEDNLLKIAFCRTLISLSNASFNHQSMSFKAKSADQPGLFGRSTQFDSAFLRELKAILLSARGNPTERARILLADSKALHNSVEDAIDLVITSPPYPNRMSYIRELRPYMYWLGFLSGAREAGEMDWSAIGGTWGIATSRLTSWQADSADFLVPELENFLGQMTQVDKKSSSLLANYVSKYFYDIWGHLGSLSKVLNRSAQVNFIVGNSSFYGVLLPVETIYQKMLKSIGFHDVNVEPLRKRNSKKALFEYNVSGVYE